MSIWFIIGAIGAGIASSITLFASYITIISHLEKKTKVNGALVLEKFEDKYKMYIELSNNGSSSIQGFELIEDETKGYPFSIYESQIKKYVKMLKIIGNDTNHLSIHDMNAMDIYNKLVEIDNSYVSINFENKYSLQGNILECKKKIIERLLFLQDYKKNGIIENFYIDSEIDIFKPSTDHKILLAIIQKPEAFFMDLDLNDIYFTAEYYTVYHLNYVFFNFMKLMSKFKTFINKLMGKDEVFAFIGERIKPKKLVFDENEKSIQFNKSQSFKIKIDKLYNGRIQEKLSNFDDLNVLILSSCYISWYKKLSKNHQKILDTIDFSKNNSILDFLKEFNEKTTKFKGLKTDYNNLVNKILENELFHSEIKIKIIRGIK